MSKRKQHPLIVAMNKFDALMTTLDASNADAFMAYVRNKVSTRRPKSSSTTAPSAGKRSRQQKSKGEPVVNTEADVVNAMTASGD